MSKTKILIYGTGIFSEKFMEECLKHTKAEVLAFVESIKSKNKFKNYDVISIGGVNGYAYDLMIVISGYLDEIRRNLRTYQIDQSKCIYTSDIHNWMCNKECVSTFIDILNDKFVEHEVKLLIENQKICSYGIAETYDGLAFVGNYADDIVGTMLDTGNVYSYDEIDAFLTLSDKFYGSNRGGYFFDCGCNIGSTAIYALQKRSDLRAVGFEPIERTWRCAKANAALNNMDQKIKLVNVALSDCNGVVKMECRQYSCGGNYIIMPQDDNDSQTIEEVSAMALDDWIIQNNFDISSIRYLWIDTEGYEGYVLKGMMKLLRQKKIPMYIEYYTYMLNRSNSKEVLLDCLEEIYSQYIIVKRGGIYDIADIREVKELRNIEEMEENLFLIP